MRLKIVNFDKVFGKQIKCVTVDATMMYPEMAYTIINLNYSKLNFKDHVCYDFGVEHVGSGTTLECCLTIWDANTEHNPSDDHIISLETFNPDKEYILTPDDVSYEQNFLNAIFKNIIVNHNK